MNKQFKKGFNAGISVIRDWLTMNSVLIEFEDGFFKHEDGRKERLIGYEDMKKQLEPYTDKEIEDNWLAKLIYEEKD
jgi:hypothetical protein